MMKQKNNLCTYAPCSCITLHFFELKVMFSPCIAFLERAVLFVYFRALIVISLLQCDLMSVLPSRKTDERKETN